MPTSVFEARVLTIYHFLIKILYLSSSSPGWGPYLYPAISPIEGLLGGPDGVYDFISDGFEDVNPGLVYGSTKDKGLFAVKATKETHTTEEEQLEG